MIRGLILVMLLAESLPRTRGDDPTCKEMAGLHVKFAPHARG